MIRDPVEVDNDPIAEYFNQENREYAEYWNAHHSRPLPSTRTAGAAGDWGRITALAREAAALKAA